jgi:hypothetical protein
VKLTPVDHDPFVSQGAKLTPVDYDPFAQPRESNLSQAGASGANKAIAGLLGMPVNAIENVINLGLAAYGTAATAAGRPDLAPEPIQGSFGGSRSFEKGMGNVGVPTELPEGATTGERLAYGVGKGAAYAAAPASSGWQAAGNAAMGLASGVGGAVAKEISPNNPYAEAIGTMAPGAAALVGAAGLRSAVRGADGAPMRQTVDDFQAAGVQPTVGQATGNRAAQSTESALAKIPGSAGRMRRAADAQTESAGQRMQSVADSVSANRGPEQAGRTIERGIHGFVNRFNARTEQLDADVAAAIPQQAQFPVTNTLQRITALSQPIPGAPATSAVVVRRLMERPEVEAFIADATANNGQMPYESLRQIRTIIGQEMRSSDLIGTPAQGRLRQVYGALSQDMEAAAQATSPQAARAWGRFNSYYRAGRQRVDYLESTIKDAGEATYKAAMSGSADGATKLRAIRRSLTADEFRDVQATAIERLGRATPGNQNADADAFSFSTFLTNYNKLPRTTRNVLFPDRHSFYLDRLARVAERVREAGGVFANPSGTTPAAINIGAQAGIGAYVLSQLMAGNIGGAAKTVGAAAGAFGSANVLARAATNPDVVEWLSQGQSISNARAAQHLARLTTLAKQAESADDREEIQAIAEIAAGYQAENRSDDKRNAAKK